MVASSPLQDTTVAATSSGVINTGSVRNREFDPELLCKRLHEHRLQIDATRRKSKKKWATSQEDVPFTYRPLNAAAQFSATTVSLKGQRKDLNRSASAPQRAKPPMDVDNLSSINPKLFLARRNMGMSEAEAVMAAMGPHDVGPSTRDEVRRNASAHFPDVASRWEAPIAPLTHRLLCGDDAGSEKPRIVNCHSRQGARPTQRLRELLLLDTKLTQLRTHDRPDWTQPSEDDEDSRALLRKHRKPKIRCVRNQASD
ncbi:hypothetical protein M433DRAFT_178034, partial [Acidomyces richmondensis BFW]